MTIRLPRLDPDPEAPFPPVRTALTEPCGLLAIGGDLDPRRLLNAYRHGVFPWYAAGEPILWWSPDPRTVFNTPSHALPRRLRRQLRSSGWTLHADSAFDAVVAACATIPRRGQRGTWIDADMQAAYGALHRIGHAHSIEVRSGNDLIGGIYGVQAGGVFCGESMFSRESGASRVALAALCHTLASWGVEWVDAQVPNPHLTLLGATSIGRDDYLGLLGLAQPASARPGSWQDRFALRHAAELA